MLRPLPERLPNRSLMSAYFRNTYENIQNMSNYCQQKVASKIFWEEKEKKNAGNFYCFKKIIKSL